LSPIQKVLLGTAATAACAVLAVAVFIAWSVYHGRAVPPARAGTLKVACVGDSITYAVLLRNSYPAQLEGLLGDHYSVRNFGAIGHTVQKDGDMPYWGHPYFKLSTEFAPDLVLIMLGTNDSKEKNWKGPEAFSRDYKALVEHYQSLPSRPRVILMTPPSAFLVKGRSELPGHMSAENISLIAGLIRDVGSAMSLQVIDIQAATSDHPEFFQKDGIHPDRGGDKFIASQVYQALQAQGGDKQP